MTFAATSPMNITYKGTLTYTGGTGKFRRSGAAARSMHDHRRRRAQGVYGEVQAHRSVIDVAHKVKLYMFSGSAPSLTARLMLEHKGIDHKAVHVMVGPHAFGMLGRGFQTMTVPALKIDGRRVQGSREISRALDELAPQPPLFAADPQRRRAIEEAEEWGEELQDAARRIVLCAARREPRAFTASIATPTRSCARRSASRARS